jgi:Family of unknown function (DUF5709)
MGNLSSKTWRLVAFGVDPSNPTTDYHAHDVGIDGGATSAAKAAMQITPMRTP